MHQALLASENKSIYIINYYRKIFNKLVVLFMKSSSNYQTICEADEAVDYLLIVFSHLRVSIFLQSQFDVQFTGNWVTGTLANSEDPDEMQQL